ncbi:MAG TPA: putative holin-like toxin [Bacillales bacterium]|nr:putative holin-like toxin [Bacillales bacterium]
MSVYETLQVMIGFATLLFTMMIVITNIKK